MIPRARLIAERLLGIRAGFDLAPLPPFTLAPEQVEQGLVRMWSAGRVTALISAYVGLEPNMFRDRGRGLPRPSIRFLAAGCNQRFKASRGAARHGRLSLAYGVANDAGFSIISERAGLIP